ncbi:MAG: 30S ribosomal protein S13 [Candidatus Terrybacteria bacterium RIFCSPHIGHO2_01_FULL_48_17]|uniref:Small ribosomal subunit protein uS13 n=1 Tax=Candidatus Terrybacteria bacterium RIFCSPHIGHO2_01_FULL_48_17 TaxID=1802362 RepID=A0A1G2PHK1_9BACT|nr:MAG: 30S ribosomal protein S13 [Candidatus Terrybacteria bacterium RIFCSPHIGHO2_01_FULL_48_17]OHA53544.1 MAG: 30S ribosomal protein S13 [Candidatus Terrybacteria bacterium RIFCSPLOWO2_01_FULL_48_14]
MPRIAGINIPENKRVPFALTSIYGIGRSSAFRIVETAKINPAKKAGQLSSEEVARLRDYIERNLKVEGDLRQKIRQSIKLFKDLGSYRGIRHSKGLPVRGQRTKTNSRTVRGNVRKTVTSGKRKMEKT